MKMKRLNLILSALLVIIMIACSCATVFAAGDVSSAIESTWNDAKSQIQNVVNNVVFPVLDMILATISLKMSCLTAAKTHWCLPVSMKETIRTKL